jgi:hypothetical protein
MARLDFHTLGQDERAAIFVAIASDLYDKGNPFATAGEGAKEAMI